MSPKTAKVKFSPWVASLPARNEDVNKDAPPLLLAMML
jgi:hypothetical protein